MPPADLPAVLGGTPLCPAGPPDWPPPDEAVRLALERAFADGSWGKYHGGNVERLQARLAAMLGVPHVLTCSSGTLAVEVALRALRVGPGDEVVLVAYDYGGNFLCAHAVGATPVLVDVAADNWNLDVARLPEAFTPATKAVIASHLHGGLVPMRELTDLCAARGIAVVEDAAQVPGATVQGRPAGSWGDAGVFSFGGSKLLSAGRGGALVTRRADVAQRAKLALGRGNNLLSPLSELQAAVVLPQLDLLPERHARRLASVARLGALLEAVPGVELFRNAAEGSPAYYKVGMRYDESVFGLPRSRLTAAMRAEGAALDEGFRALHVGRAGGRFRAAGELREAERAHRGCVVLHHPVLLAEGAVAHVAAALERIRAHAGSLG